jgi:hypothetical protein
MEIWDILWPFGTFCIHLVHFLRVWYHVPIKIWQHWLEQCFSCRATLLEIGRNPIFVLPVALSRFLSRDTKIIVCVSRTSAQKVKPVGHGPIFQAWAWAWAPWPGLGLGPGLGWGLIKLRAHLHSFQIFALIDGVRPKTKDRKKVGGPDGSGGHGGRWKQPRMSRFTSFIFMDTTYVNLSADISSPANLT